MNGTPDEPRDYGALVEKMLIMLLDEVLPTARTSKSPKVQYTKGALLEALHQWNDAAEAYGESIRLERREPDTFAARYRRAITEGRRENQESTKTGDELLGFDPFLDVKERVKGSKSPDGAVQEEIVSLAQTCYWMDRRSVISRTPEQYVFEERTKSELDRLTARSDELTRLAGEVGKKYRAVLDKHYDTTNHDGTHYEDDDTFGWMYRYARASLIARLDALEELSDDEKKQLRAELSTAIAQSHGALHPIWVFQDRAFEKMGHLTSLLRDVEFPAGAHFSSDHE